MAAGNSSDCRTGTCAMVLMPRAQLRHQYGPCLPLMVYQCRLRCMTVGFIVVVILRVRGIWIVKAAKNFYPWLIPVCVGITAVVGHCGWSVVLFQVVSLYL